MKTLKVWGISLAVIVAAVIVVVVIFMLIQPLLYKDYYSKAQREFPVAGLSDGLVPQGFTYLPEEGLFLQCGYMADGVSASRIYITDGTGAGRYVELYADDGTPYLGHTGGITAGEKKVWLANDGEGSDNRVWAFSKEELLDENTSRITLSASFKPESRAACCFVYDGYLWVGEFRDAENYETKKAITLPRLRARSITRSSAPTVSMRKIKKVSCPTWSPIGSSPFPTASKASPSTPKARSSSPPPTDCPTPVCTSTRTSSTEKITQR